MPTSGLVLTLRDRADAPSPALLARLAAEREVEVGPCFAGRLALVASTPDPGRDKALWERLGADPEVLSVALAFAHFDTLGAGPGATRP